MAQKPYYYDNEYTAETEGGENAIIIDPETMEINYAKKIK